MRLHANTTEFIQFPPCREISETIEIVMNLNTFQTNPPRSGQTRLMRGKRETIVKHVKMHTFISWDGLSTEPKPFFIDFRCPLAYALDPPLPRHPSTSVRCSQTIYCCPSYVDFLDGDVCSF